MTEKKETSSSNKPNQPHIQYRVQVEKRIQINRSFNNIHAQAKAMQILSFALFGKKRYQNLYLVTSLNCFYYALKIANNIHQRVPGLAMIIKFQEVDVFEYYAQEFQGKMYQNKKFSRIVIKLTKDPTQEDKQQPGYNPGLKNQDIERPLTQVLKNRKANRGERGNNRQRKRVGDRNNAQRRKYNNNHYKDSNKNYNNSKKSSNVTQKYQKKIYNDEQDQRRYNSRRNQNKNQGGDTERRNYRDKGFRRYADDREDYPSSRRQQSSRLDQDKQRQNNRNNNKNSYNNNKKEEQSYQRGQRKSRGAPAKGLNTKNRNNQDDIGDRRPSRRNRYQDQD